MPSCKYLECKGYCCKWMPVLASSVDYDEDWVTGRRGIRRGPWIFLPSRCKFIAKDNKGCSLHGTDKKPKYCQDWPKKNYDFLKYMRCKYFDEEGDQNG
jgi:hypothetical protein